MSQINAKNANSEMNKRIRMTKKMMDEGRTLFEISNYFGLSMDTIKRYVHQIRFSTDSNLFEYKKNESMPKVKEKKVLANKAKVDDIKSLNSLTQKELKSGESFSDSDAVKGATCGVCSNYNLFDKLIKWNKKSWVCKKCIPHLTPDKLKKLS